jgi:hypothetical protein
LMERMPKARQRQNEEKEWVPGEKEW